MDAYRVGNRQAFNTGMTCANPYIAHRTPIYEQESLLRSHVSILSHNFIKLLQHFENLDWTAQIGLSQSIQTF